jgi:5-formyltetrahydrofolate cyclo-ligase
MRYGGPGGEKQRIRMETRQISMSLAPAYRAEASCSIVRQVLELPAWQKAKTVMAYVIMPEEPDTKEIIREALDQGKTMLLPCCIDREHMVAVPVKDLSGMKIGRLGIPEPEPLPEGTEIPEPEVILVPCVAATLNGIRLGHGAGYFDRFLAAHGGMTVCLCFRRLLRADLPAEDTDVPVDLVITD